MAADYILLAVAAAVQIVLVVLRACGLGLAAEVVAEVSPEVTTLILAILAILNVRDQLTGKWKAE